MASNNMQINLNNARKQVENFDEKLEKVMKIIGSDATKTDAFCFLLENFAGTKMTPKQQNDVRINALIDAQMKINLNDKAVFTFANGDQIYINKRVINRSFISDVLGCSVDAIIAVIGGTNGKSETIIGTRQNELTEHHNKAFGKSVDKHNRLRTRALTSHKRGNGILNGELVSKDYLKSLVD